MSLLVPDTGLLFWMTLSFAVVLIVLVRYAFPVILRALDERRAGVAKALDDAQKAEQKLAGAETEAARILDKAQADRAALLKETQQLRQAMLDKAEAEAETQAAARMEKARVEAEELRRRTLDEAMDQIAGLSVRIAEKVVGEQLSQEGEQRRFIDRLLGEEPHKPEGKHG